MRNLLIIDDLNEVDFEELLRELPEEPPFEFTEDYDKWCEEQIEISKMLSKKGVK